VDPAPRRPARRSLFGLGPTGRTRARTRASPRTRPKSPVLGSLSTTSSASSEATPSWSRAAAVASSTVLPVISTHSTSFSVPFALVLSWPSGAVSPEYLHRYHPHRFRWGGGRRSTAVQPLSQRPGSSCRWLCAPRWLSQRRSPSVQPLSQRPGSSCRWLSQRRSPSVQPLSQRPGSSCRWLCAPRWLSASRPPALRPEPSNHLRTVPLLLHLRISWRRHRSHADLACRRGHSGRSNLGSGFG